MWIFTAFILFSSSAEARGLKCNVTSQDGLYAGGELVLSEEAGVEVKWKSEAGAEKTLIGGSKVCGLETQALRYPVRCTSTFTTPTPLRKMQSICRSYAPDGASTWVGSLALVISPANGEAQANCRTSLGPYTDFRLNLNRCNEW